MSVKVIVNKRKANLDDIVRFKAHQSDVDWRSEHDAEICEKYKGKYIAIANKEVFDGDTFDEAFDKAEAKYPNFDPYIEYIPAEEETWIL